MGNGENGGAGQFGLLKTRRFAPFFWTQFLGAFNDNLFKNALLILIAYRAGRDLGLDPDVLINVAAGLFILPFFLFSATAGQVSDKFEKSMLIRRIKLLEIGIMTAAALAFFANSLMALLPLLFLMGTQSTFFGPVKYSIIPQHLTPEEVVGGNGLVGMGTFLAILLGTLTGGVLIQKDHAAVWVGLSLMAAALAGWLASRRIPEAPAPAPEMDLRWNVFSQTWRTIGFGRRVHSVFLSILGISWFWLLGAAYLTQIPNFTREVLRSNEGVVTLLLTMFSVGIGAGSLLCERLSGRKVELGLVPLGSIGLSVFGFDLFLAYEAPPTTELMGVGAFLASDGSFRVLADLALIGVFGGFYIVPLFAFVQTRTEPAHRARVIAANNILNALFMVLSTASGVVILGVLDLSIPTFFLILAIANALVALYIYSVVPDFTMRFLIWMLTHTMYRVRHRGLENIPDEGAAVLVCNHVSLVDGPLIAGAVRRPIRFVMYEPIYRTPVLHFIFKTGKAIPIASRKENPEAYEAAFEKIGEALDAGDLIGIFPEGRLSSDGEMGEFRKGVEKILKRNPVPVAPMALRGLWGSFFSRARGSAMSRPLARFWSKVELVADEPIPGEAVTAETLREKVLELRGKAR
ncbi:MAG: MFS transporter [Thermodesulfobacteriota bacterium]